MSGSAGLSAGDPNALALNSGATDIPLQAGRGVVQPNPLQSLGQFAQIQNQLNQNKLFPGQQALQQQAVQGGQLNLMQHFRQAGAAAMAPLLAKQGVITHDDVTNSMAQAEASGVSSQPTLAAIAKLPANDPATFDAGVRSYIQANTQPADRAVGAVTGQIGMQDTGAGFQGFRQTPAGSQGAGAINPVGGALPKGFAPTIVNTGPNLQPLVNGQPGRAPIPLATSPETNAALHEVYTQNPDGTYSRTIVPRSALPGASGQPQSPMGTGRNTPVPPALQGPNAAAGGSQAPTGATTPPSGGILAAPPPGANEAVAADVAKFKQDQLAIPQGQQNVQSLHKALDALNVANTGRSSEGVHNMLAFLQTNGFPLPPSLDDNVANYDIAHKYLMDYARKSGAAANSDLQLQSAQGANASTGISNQAAVNVVQTNIGRERQAIAQNMEAPQTGIGYGAHTSQFSSATDPRGFAVDTYKPDQLTNMVKNMTDAERAKFYKSVGVAQRLKLINPPQAAAGPTN